MNKDILVRSLGCLVLASVALSLPLIIRDLYILDVAIKALVNIVLAVSLYLVFAMGQFSIAHAAFAAIGAYTSGLLVLHAGLSFWLACPLASVFAGLLGLGLGRLALGLKGFYFLAVTFAFAEIVIFFIRGGPSILGGLSGIYNIPPPDPITFFGLTLVDFRSRAAYYYLILGFAVVTTTIIYRLDKSRYGKILKATASNEVLADCLGIDTLGYKMSAFAISSGFAGLAGSFLAFYLGLLHPDSFGTWTAIFVVLYCQIGGLGSVIGPVIGAIVLSPLPTVLGITRMLEPLLYGAILVLVVFFFPHGLVNLPQTVRGLITNLIAKNRGNTLRGIT